MGDFTKAVTIAGVTAGLGGFAITLQEVHKWSSTAISAFQAASHGITQGGLSALQGGDFGSGFVSGALGSLAGSATQGMSSGSRIVFGGVAGGLGSILTGGNLWEGAAIGAVVVALNHLGSHEDKPIRQKNGTYLLPEIKVRASRLGQVAGGVVVGMRDPYQEGSANIKTIEQWEERYRSKSYWEIATEDGWKDYLPAGPKKEYRYVQNPVDGKIMDMRHVVVVGYTVGDVGGLAVEQWTAGKLGHPTAGLSAFNRQDFYSNRIGSSFASFQTTQFHTPANSGSWATQLVNFLKR